MNYRISGAALATVLAALGMAGGASAQSAPLTSLSEALPLPALDIDIDNAYGRGRNVSVLERERPEYASLGEHVGSFTLFPKLETALAYDTNVYATHKNVASDGLAIVKPAFELQSNWSRHAVEFGAGGEFHEFVSNSSQNQTGWFTHANGHLDVYGDSYLAFGADAEHSYESRTNAGSPADAAKPVPQNTEGAYVRGIWQLNRFRTTLGVEDRESDYENVPAQNVNTRAIRGVLDESALNHNDWRLIGREEFAISPDTAVFGQFGYSSTNYTRPHVTVALNGSANAPIGTVSRNSNEVRGMVGANFDFAALMRGEFGVGYVDREYETIASHSYPTISGAMFEGKLEYFPSELTTVTLVASRLVQDAIYSISSGGYFDNQVNLRVDHELLRNLLLNAAVGYDQQEYQGADRHDHVFTVQGGANYFVNRSVGLGVTVNYADRNANGSVFTNSANPAAALAKPQFNITTVMFSLVLQR